MNDYHLDPPEDPEMPECCGMEMLILDDGSLVCFACGDTVDAPVEPCDVCKEVPPFTCEFRQRDFPPLCPHDNKWGDCDECDHLGDLAFDASRESR